MKAFTKYVCPAAEDGALGHRSYWTGAYLHPRPNDGKCVCGRTLVEEDTERWELSWEINYYGRWCPISVIQSRQATFQQRDGLRELERKGDAIRNVRCRRLS